jgi:hypothetical protein
MEVVVSTWILLLAAFCGWSAHGVFNSWMGWRRAGRSMLPPSTAKQRARADRANRADLRLVTRTAVPFTPRTDAPQPLDHFDSDGKTRP